MYDRGSPLFKSCVVSHGLPHHLYFIVITFVFISSFNFIVTKINVKKTLDNAMQTDRITSINCCGGGFLGCI